MLPDNVESIGSLLAACLAVQSGKTNAQGSYLPKQAKPSIVVSRQSEEITIQRGGITMLKIQCMRNNW